MKIPFLFLLFLFFLLFLHLLLRLASQVKQQLEEEDSSTGNYSYKQWAEFVDDLWTDKLAHLREGGKEEMRNERLVEEDVSLHL